VLNNVQHVCCTDTPACAYDAGSTVAATGSRTAGDGAASTTPPASSTTAKADEEEEEEELFEEELDI